MGTPIHVVLIAAGITAVVAVLVGWLARSTARDIAVLSAQQKRADVRIAALRDYIDLLITCAGATQALMWYGDKKYLSRDTVTTDQWHEARPLVQPAQEALARVQHLGSALVDESLRSDYDQFVADIHRVLVAGDQPSNEAWHEIVSQKPTSIVRAVQSANDLYRRALADYPVAVRSSVLSRCLRR